MPVTSHGRATPGGAAGGYTGGKGNWGSGSTGPEKGGKGGANIKEPEKEKKPVPSEQVFEVECTGMKPETIHTFYYEGVDSGKYCKPKGKKIGDPIKTDAKGFVQFNFYFTGAVEKAIDISNKVKYELAGDKKFELKATDSSASKVVPMTGKYQEPKKSKDNPFFDNNFFTAGGQSKK